jgi:hypothetical protein
MEASKTKITSIASKEMSGRTTEKEEKSYHKQATGEALKTVEKRSKEHNLKLYGGCFWYLLFLFDRSIMLISHQSLCSTSMDFTGIQGHGLPVH